MNLVKDEETGTWVTQYGRAAIVRPAIDTRMPPSVIPRAILPTLARQQAVEDRAGVCKRRRTRLSRMLGFLLVVTVYGLATIITFWIPSESIGNVRHRESGSNSILSLPWLQNYAHNLSQCWGAFILWMIFIIIGHAYVAFFSCGRSNPFKTIDDKYRDIFLLVGLGVVLFVVGPVFTIASMHIPNTVSTRWVQHTLAGWIPTMKDAESDDGDQNDLTLLYTHHISWRFTFAAVHNFLFYVLPFSVGLHFTYVEQIPRFWNFQRKLGQPRYWRTLNCCDLSFFVLMIVVSAVVLGFHFWLLYLERLLVIYITLYFLFTSVIAGVSIIGWRWIILRWRFWAALVVLFPVTRFFNPITGITQALLAGILVERATSLGFEFIWISRKYVFYRRLYRFWLRGEGAIGDKDTDLLPYLPLTDHAIQEMDTPSHLPDDSSIHHEYHLHDEGKDNKLSNSTIIGRDDNSSVKEKDEEGDEEDITSSGSPEVVTSTDEDDGALLAETSVQSLNTNSLRELDSLMWGTRKEEM